MYIILSSLFAVMLIAILLIIVRTKTKSRKRKKTFQQSLDDTSKQYYITWTQSEIQLYRALGWNKEKRLLLFHHFAEDNKQQLFIDMNTVLKSKLVEEKQSAHNKSQDNHVVAVWIELQDNQNQLHKLCFYHEMQDGVFEKSRLTQKARIWMKMIEQH